MLAGVAGVDLARYQGRDASAWASLLEQVRRRRARRAISRRAGPVARSYRWFTDPAERLRYPEHDRDRQSRAQVANLRAAYGSMGPRSRAGELARALQKASAEFAGLWERHEVARRFEDHKTLIHPELGPIEVDCQVLFTEDQSQALLVLTAPPRTEGYEKLQLLAVLGPAAVRLVTRLTDTHSLAGSSWRRSDFSLRRRVSARRRYCVRIGCAVFDVRRHCVLLGAARDPNSPR